MTRQHVRTPLALVYAPRVSDGAMRLWMVLDDVCRDAVRVRLTLGQVAAAASRDPKQPLSRSTVKRWRGELVAAGWLRWEAGEHRGDVSSWEPLHRARPVDNRSGRGAHLDPSHQGKGSTSGPLDAAATHARAPEQAPTPAWCGHCDSPDYRWVVDEEARPVRRCPSCHPDYAAHPAF